MKFVEQMSMERERYLAGEEEVTVGQLIVAGVLGGSFLIALPWLLSGVMNVL